MLTRDLIQRALVGPTPEPVRRGLDLLPAWLSASAKPAAVVVPVVLDPAGGMRVVVVERGAELRDHAGEIGFPGGKPEAGDADLLATALRELGEELDLVGARDDVVGSLVPMPVITGRYLIHSFVTLVPHVPTGPAPGGEASRVLALDVRAYLEGRARIDSFETDVESGRFVAPHFALDGAVLYGASAFLFYELLLRVARELGLALPALTPSSEPPWGRRYPRP